MTTVVRRNGQSEPYRLDRYWDKVEDGWIETPPVIQHHNSDCTEQPMPINEIIAEQCQRMAREDS